MELQVFKNNQFGEVRTILIDNKPYFVGSDVAKILGYSIPHKAVREHCKGVLKQTIPTNGGSQEMLVISRGDVYRLIAKCQLSIGEKFESWIFDEVIPSIHDNGGYIANQENLSDSELMAKALIVAQTVIENRNKLFELLRQKGILMQNNQPYQKYIDAGYFRTIEQKWNDKEGTTHINIKTLVFQKGLNYIRKLVS